MSDERWVRIMDLRQEDCVPGQTVRWRDGHGCEGTLTWGERIPTEPSELAFTIPTPRLHDERTRA